METLIRARLLATAALSAVPVNFGQHPQGEALPGIVVNVASGSTGLTLAESDGLTQGRVQVDCYAPTYAGTVTLGAAVLDALHGWGSGNLRLVAHAATRDSREGGANEAERPFRRSLDFTTHWRAS